VPSRDHAGRRRSGNSAEAGSYETPGRVARGCGSRGHTVPVGRSRRARLRRLSAVAGGSRFRFVASHPRALPGAESALNVGAARRTDRADHAEEDAGDEVCSRSSVAGHGAAGHRATGGIAARRPHTISGRGRYIGLACVPWFLAAGQRWLREPKTAPNKLQLASENQKIAAECILTTNGNSGLEVPT